MRRLVLGIAVAVTSLMPTMGMADDQQIADYIKSRLQVEQQQGNLRGFNVDMRVDRGTVWFKGHVSNESQEKTILTTAQQAGHLGVVQIVDDIDVKSAQSVMDRAPAAAAQQGYQPTPAQQSQFQNVAYQQQLQSANPYRQTSSQEYIQASSGGAVEGIVNGGQPLPFASSNGGQYAPAGYGGGPVPMGGNYTAAGMPNEAPNLPGYAWPGYAAHPNYAAVSYPKQYSPSAWPYIGPFYPYPQVPLGWRKVTLEWDDGWWMLDFNDK